METCEDVSISDELTESQKEPVRNLLIELSIAFSGRPNLANACSHP